MDLIQALVLGIIQGLTEFLPISSTAHLRVVPAFFGWDDPGAAFTAVIQLGTLMAVLIYFRRDLGRAFMAWLRSFSSNEVAKTQDARMGWAIFIGTIPIVVLGFLFKEQIKGETVRSLYVIAWMLIGMAIVLAIADHFGRHARLAEKATAKDGLWVGLWQAIALIPGASRSGSSITGALFLGFDRAAAAKFSFLLSVPSVLAAGILELVEERKAILDENLANVLVATLAAFVVGYWSIGLLIRFLQAHRVTGFVIYRLALGVLLLVLLARGDLEPEQGLPDKTPSPVAAGCDYPVRVVPASGLGKSVADGRVVPASPFVSFVYLRVLGEPANRDRGPGNQGSGIDVAAGCDHPVRVVPATMGGPQGQNRL